jgi:hypothetical protein
VGCHMVRSVSSLGGAWHHLGLALGRHGLVINRACSTNTLQ